MEDVVYLAHGLRFKNDVFSTQYFGLSKTDLNLILKKHLRKNVSLKLKIQKQVSNVFETF